MISLGFCNCRKIFIGGLAKETTPGQFNYLRHVNFLLASLSQLLFELAPGELENLNLKPHQLITTEAVNKTNLNIKPFVSIQLTGYIGVIIPYSLFAKKEGLSCFEPF